MLKKMTVLILILLVVSGMIMASGTKAEAKKYFVGFSTFSLGNSWAIQLIEELKYAVSQDKEIEKFVMTNSEWNISKQVSDIDDLITKGADIILVSAQNPQSLVPVVNKAMKQGIVVVFMAITLPKDYNVTAYVTVDQNEFGRVQARWLSKAMNYKGEIIAFNGMKGIQNSIDRFDGAKEIFDKYPGIKIVNEVWADWDYAKAKRAMESLFAAFPKIDGIWSQGGAMSEAVIEAYLERGLPPPLITGEDGNGFLKIWKKIKDSGKYPKFDSIATSMPTWISVKSLEIAKDAVHGKKVPKETVIPIPTITAETLEQYVKPDLPNSYWCNSTLPEEVAKKVFQR